MKLERRLLAHYVDSANYEESSPVYVRLGKHLTEYNVSMNANAETTNNILGDSYTEIDGYQPQSQVTPYYADKDDPLFTRLQEIYDKRLTLDDLLTTVVEVHLWEKETGVEDTYVAYREDAVIEITDFGGDTKGVQIPFNLHMNGNRTKGTFALKTKTFTPES